VAADAPGEILQELPPPIPAEALELFNIGVDFAQRLSILWAADLQWPKLFSEIMRWLVSFFSFDLGILVPSLSPTVRAVVAWVLPVAIMSAVRIIDRLHGSSGSTWNMLFTQRWSTIRSCWLFVFITVSSCLGVATHAASGLQEALLVATAYWVLLNLVVAFLVGFARAQAQRTHVAAQKHGLDDDAMMAGFHKFMHHSLCTGIGLFFVASWLPPVRASLDSVLRDSDEDSLAAFALGIAMMVAAASAFLCLPSIMAALLYGQNSQTKCLGLPIACLWPAPFSLLMFGGTIILFKALLLNGSDFMIASGFMLPWNVALPVACITLSLRMFRSHSFGAMIAGDFHFQYHRIIAFMLRASFAAAIVLTAMLSSGRGVKSSDLFPGVGVLVVNLLYIIVLRPYRQKVGNALDATGSAVLGLILMVPVLPRSSVVDVLLACVPLLFILFWICALNPRGTVKALWYAPTRMRAKLQATIHSPEWIYARPILEVSQIHPQELIFWSCSHVDALADRCRACLRGQEEIPKLRMLLKLCALHAQESTARLQAAEAMEVQGFGDVEIYTAALNAQLEHLAKELNSTDSGMRCAAAKGLGNVGEPAWEYADALAKRCKDGETTVRAAAALALGQIGPKAAKHTLRLAQMLTDKDGDTRLASAQALGQMGAAAFEQSEALSQKLPQNHPFLGIAAAWTFGKNVTAPSSR
jgi:hypothetical protein